MIFAPGSLARIDSAKSAVAKSPGTNSPVSSTKKQRSESPSKATLKSARSSSVFAMMNSRFSGRSGFGSWFGKLPSGAKKLRCARTWGSHSRTGGSIAPAMSGGQSHGQVRKREGSVSDVQEAGVAADGQRALADDLHARVLLRIVRRGDRDPAVEPELTDREVDHLRPDQPEIEHVRALGDRPACHGLDHGRRRGAHVVADRDPVRLEDLHEGTADRLRTPLVELGRVDPADVVGLEDLRIEHGRMLCKNHWNGSLGRPNSFLRLVGMERKLATVLFVDLVDSTALVTGADPEVVRRRVQTFFDRVSHCVITHGGIVEKFAGDAVMAAFGIPVAHEDDAERAVRAGLAILDAVEELKLEARVGVEAGEIVTEDGEATFATGE